jgi:hypothetical protein
MTERLEELREAGENVAFDEISTVVQHGEHWPTSDFLGKSLVELWHDGRYGLHCHLRTVVVVGHVPPNEYCIRFENGSEILNPPENDAALDPKNRLGKHRGRPSRRQRTVLVPVGNGAQLPEQRGLRPSPAVVWLQTLDECPHAARHARQVLPHARELLLFSLGKPAEKLQGRIHNRELDLMLLFGEGRGEHPGEMVQTRTQLVSRFADVHPEIGRTFVDPLHAVDHSALAVTVASSFVDIRFPKNFSGLVESFSVFLSAPELPEEVREFYRQRVNGRLRHVCAGEG